MTWHLRNSICNIKVHTKLRAFCCIYLEFEFIEYIIGVDACYCMHNFLLADMVTWQPADKAMLQHSCPLLIRTELNGALH